MDRPGYLGAIQSFRAAGAKLIGWDIARADSDELEDLLVRYRPKLIYTNPTFQNPTGMTMPIRTRRELLSLAQRYRVPIVEDATYRELYFTDAPPPSLRELDDQNLVIYLNSFSKVLAPGLRLGWLRRRRRSWIRWPSSSSGWIRIRRTWADRSRSHHPRGRVRRAPQDDAYRTCEALHADDCRDTAPRAARIDPLRAAAGRPVSVVSARTRSSATALHERALAAGVTFVPGPAFYPDPAGDSELRLCFTNVLTSSKKASGAWRVASVRSA